ncbi:MAG: hypothetical protein O3B64_03090 [bacterium]|nr:hypothetical protein [bacterium]MDA1024408.1 hypothetical protein [bacterium]
MKRILRFFSALAAIATIPFAIMRLTKALRKQQDAFRKAQSNSGSNIDSGKVVDAKAEVVNES